jgi:hypothetical protein
LLAGLCEEVPASVIGEIKEFVNPIIYFKYYRTLTYGTKASPTSKIRQISCVYWKISLRKLID